MNSKKKLLKKSRLYAIIDKEIAGNSRISAIAAKIKYSGIDIIQLRDKKSKKGIILQEARRLRKLLSKSNVLFIIDDYLEIAKITDTDGVHLGQYDASVETARKILGKEKIIGISCHNLKGALLAQERGADYISIGPLFATALKPRAKPIGFKYIKEINKKIRIPVFGIGGINENNIQKVLSCGIKRIAVCRAICRADNAAGTIKRLKEVILDTMRR